MSYTPGHEHWCSYPSGPCDCGHDKKQAERLALKKEKEKRLNDE